MQKDCHSAKHGTALSRDPTNASRASSKDARICLADPF